MDDKLKSADVNESGAFALSDPAQFGPLVIDRSHTVPVLVDFWANWCGPCHMLAPVLDKLAQELGDALSLVKVETDQHPELAAQYGVRSLPTVMLFKNGQVVDQFLGAQPESAIRTILSRHIVTETDQIMVEAETELAQGNLQRAQDLFTSVLAKHPSDDKARMQLARVMIDTGQLDTAQNLLQEVDRGVRQDPPYRMATAALELAQTSQTADDDPTEMAQIVANDPSDLKARYQLALTMIKSRRFDDALEQLLEIIKRDRQYKEGVAHGLVLKVFETLGGQGETVARYRGLLARALH